MRYLQNLLPQSMFLQKATYFWLKTCFLGQKRKLDRLAANLKI